MSAVAGRRRVVEQLYDTVGFLLDTVFPASTKRWRDVAIHTQLNAGGVRSKLVKIDKRDDVRRRKYRRSDLYRDKHRLCCSDGPATNALWWALLAILAVLWWGARAPWGS